jgi:hypothetical protein
MAKGEEVMPVPGGEVSTSQIWSNTDAVSNQIVEETQEDSTTGQADAQEQALVESGSETEE